MSTSIIQEVIDIFCDSCHSEFSIMLGPDQQEGDIKFCSCCGALLDQDLQLDPDNYDEGWDDPDLQ